MTYLSDEYDTLQEALEACPDALDPVPVLVCPDCGALCPANKFHVTGPLPLFTVEPDERNWWQNPEFIED